MVVAAVCATPGCRGFALGGGRFCGVHARGEERRRARLPVKRVYASARWRRARAVVLERDRVCRLCGVAAAVSVDHWPVPAGVLLERGGDPFDPGGLRGLCRACHGGVDGGRGAG